MTRRLIPSGCPIIGAVMARRRRALGIKQRELAGRIDSSRSAVAMYERGLKAIPSRTFAEIERELACVFEGARRDHSPHHGAVMRAGRSGVTCRPTGDTDSRGLSPVKRHIATPDCGGDIEAACDCGWRA